MDVEGNLLLAKLLIKKEKETLNGMIQTLLLLLLLPLLFSTVQPVTRATLALLSRSCSAIVLLVAVCESFHWFQLFSIGITTQSRC